MLEVDGRPWDEFLAERPVVVLATVSADGAPHAVPVEVLVRNGTVWAWCERSSVKARNAEREGRAAIVGYKGHKGVLVRGAARLVGSDDDRYEPVTRGFLDKYQREETYGNDTLIAVSPDRVTVF